MANDEALQGVAKLVQTLKAIGGLDDGKVLRAAVRAGMQPALASARARIPVSLKAHKVYTGRRVDPGFAKKSLRVITTITPDKTRASALLGTRKEAFYAVQFVELGTSRAAAHPWLRPAFHATSNEQKAAIASEIGRYLYRKAAEGV